MSSVQESFHHFWAVPSFVTLLAFVGSFFDDTNDDGEHQMDAAPMPCHSFKRRDNAA